MKVLRVPIGAAAYCSVVNADYTLLPLENDFLRYLRFAKDRAESTTKRYAETLAIFADWRERTGRDLQQALVDLHHFVIWLRMTPVNRHGSGQGRARSGKRVNQMLAPIREFAKHAVIAGAVPSSVLAALWEVADDRMLPAELKPEGGGLQYRAVPRHRVKETRRTQPTTATQAEAEALLRVALSHRDRFIIGLLWTTGIRVGGALGLRRSDMHLVGDARALGCQIPGPHIHLVRRDNPNGAAIKANEYAVPVRSDLLTLYERYLLEREQALRADSCDFVLVNIFHQPLGQPMTYPIVRQMLAGLSKKAGLNRTITPHMLRHGTARQLITHGADISMVQSILGQASIVSTQVYVTPDEDARRAAMNALPPLVGPGRA